MTSETLPTDREPVLRVMPRTADTNAAGDIFGGWIMSQVDMAGAVLAFRRARGRVATIAVNAFTFKKPVYVSDLVSFYANVTKVGTTSITIEVQVFAERGWRSPDFGKVILVTEATLTYVAVDDEGNKRPVPPAT
jgi:acyl-CoA thioesterase YciA